MSCLICGHLHLQQSTFQQRNFIMIKDIHIQNYRGIKDLKIKDFKRINLLVGDNNSGKTSVLEALLLITQPRNPMILFELEYHRNLDFSEGVQLETFLIDQKIINDNLLWEKLSLACFNKNTSDPISIKANESLGLNEHLEIVFDLKTKNFGGENSINLNLNFNPTLPQSVIFKYSQNSEDTGFSVGASGKSFHGAASKSICDHSYLTFVQKTRSRSLIPKLSKVLKEKAENKQKLLNIISQIDPKIIDIFVDAERPQNSSIAIRLNGLDGTITLDHFGDGIINVLRYVLTIYEHKNSVILIDEIENGLHWKTQAILWKIILTAAKENNVQIIATTHSRDTIKALSEVYEKEKDLVGEDEIRLFQLYKNDKNFVETLDANTVKGMIKNNYELR